MRSSCSWRCCSRRAESAQQLREVGENGIRKESQRRAGSGEGCPGPRRASVLLAGGAFGIGSGARDRDGGSRADAQSRHEHVRDAVLLPEKPPEHGELFEGLARRRHRRVRASATSPMRIRVGKKNTSNHNLSGFPPGRNRARARESTNRRTSPTCTPDCRRFVLFVPSGEIVSPPRRAHRLALYTHDRTAPRPLRC